MYLFAYDVSRCFFNVMILGYYVVKEYQNYIRIIDPITPKLV